MSAEERSAAPSTADSTEGQNGAVPAEGETVAQAEPSIGLEEPTAAAGGQAGEVERLKAELEAEKAKAADYLTQWQRAAADFTNFRRRSEQERAEMAKLFNASLVGQLLPVLDNFERALGSVPAELAQNPWIEGVTLTEKQLRAALEKEGLNAIEARGQKFDPNLHEAVAHEDSAEHEEGTIVEEFQKGYKLHDRVLRPSMVKVSKRS